MKSLMALSRINTHQPTPDTTYLPPLPDVATTTTHIPTATYRGKDPMALLDWARGVAGGGGRRSPNEPGIVYGVARDGTDVDVDEDEDEDRGSGTSSSEVRVDRRGDAGRGWVEEAEGSFSDDVRDERDHLAYDPVWESHAQFQPPHPHLHPFGTCPFPQQPHLQPPPLHPDTSSSKFSAGWQSPRISDRIPQADELSAMEQMTLGGTTVGAGTAVDAVPFSSMRSMNGALKREQRREEHDAPSETSPVTHPSATATTTALQSQIRTLQAQIIASHVSRSSLERNVLDAHDEARAYRAELAEAVRALRRAKAETKKLDDERRKGVRLYEETRERLVKYHEALKVQEARDAGREEGRLEAFHEIERWMTAPPIPIDPIGSIPANVVRPWDQAHGHDGAAGCGRERGRKEQQRDGGRYEAGSGRRDAEYFSGQNNDEPGPVHRQDAFPAAHQTATGFLPPTDPRDGYDLAPPRQTHPQRPSPGQASGFIPLRQTPPVLPEKLTPLNAADAYLDRVEHDSRLQGLLAGTSAHAGPGYSQKSDAARPAHTRRHSSNPSHLDKPLPAPHQQHRRYVSHGDPSAYAGSPQGAGPGRGSAQSTRQMNGLQGHKSYGKADRGISQPDRYPPFQTQGTSILDHAVPVLSPDQQPYAIPPGHVDPRHVPLPDSRTASAFGGSGHPARQTGGPSFASLGAATNRSRLAVGLRNEDDLSMIEERDEKSTGVDYSPRGHAQDAHPSRGHVKPARSMQSLPSWKIKPKIVLPKRLGAPGTDIRMMPDLNEQQMRELLAHQQAEAMRRGDLRPPTDTLPPEVNATAKPMPHTIRDEERPHRQEGPQARDAPSMSINPAHIPLPPTRYGTVYTEAPERTFPGISVIDFAARIPLPESRAPTVISRAGERYPLKATVETIDDRDAPHHRVPGSILKRDKSPGPGRRKTSSACDAFARPAEEAD
ncbi:hypothetical protein NliqN6_5088 [Naganishia liquefaciens]|uniref:Uncharacterized protein n=1 Tax=Naganishia liquefaciens TaxID=104408 RepID=A0A8H3TXF4_9TREE|nr:hypothetical protein NliqN6_5088 [Naganishia liquefaciens]